MPRAPLFVFSPIWASNVPPWHLQGPILVNFGSSRLQLLSKKTNFGRIWTKFAHFLVPGTTLRRTFTVPVMFSGRPEPPSGEHPRKNVSRMFSGCLEPPSGEHSHRNPLQECSPGVWNHPPEKIHTEMSSTNVLRVSGTNFRRTFTQNEF